MSSPALEEAYQLTSAARDLTRVEHAELTVAWPRASALLARQGLELALTALWQARAPGLERQSMHCQLLCLGPLLGDAELAGRVSLAWGALSGACHVRVYEVAPGAFELSESLHAAWELCEAVQRATA